MSETVKTLIYVGAAVLFCSAAVASRMWVGEIGVPPPEMLGKPLFPEFKDPASARRLRITRFNETLGKIDKFEVAQLNGTWVIPSNSNYPADATERMKEAATSLIGLKVIGVASDIAKDHSLYGVVEPDADKVEEGDVGVGVLVDMEGAKGKNVARLIIGKEVKDAEDQRFVRVPGQSRVFIVKFDLDKLSRKFGDWIEKDLLKLNSLDVESIALKDYSIVTAVDQFNRPRLVPQERNEIFLTTDGAGWKLKRLREKGKEGWVETDLGENEELNNSKLNDLKSALADLKIVDVVRKPKGLAANLKTSGDFLQDEEGILTLQSRGFFLGRGQGNQVDLMGRNGELLCGTKDGVEYLLRFGEIAGVEEDSDGKLNRYLLVTAQTNVPPPKLAPEPQPDPADQAPKPAGTEEAGEQEAGDKEAQPEKVDPALVRIRKENQRLMDEYKATQRKAEAKVAALNARFADWYYVISEDVYKRLDLGVLEIVQESEPYGVDAFRELTTDGLEEEPASPSGPPGGLPPGFPG